VAGNRSLEGVRAAPPAHTVARELSLVCFLCLLWLVVLCGSACIIVGIGRPSSNSEQSSTGISATLLNMPSLLLANLPHNASNRELHEWVESRGINTNSIRMIPNLLAGMSTALVELKEGTDTLEAISILNGKRMRTQIVLATTGRNT
jgi:hypothetical protein